ncbi:MAG: hypothetical protein LQ347_005751 [Umbilicaria vellea]|nr:MAG: hypothetical protein LQ347_005751 [Umbilicaria vellea]
MAESEAGTDSQTEALMKAHALIGQVCVVCASNYVDESCLEWMAKSREEQDFVNRGGGWSAVIHPFCVFLAGPHSGEEEKLVATEIDQKELAAVKVWVDAAGHYKKPEVIKFNVNIGAIWEDDRRIVSSRHSREDVGADAVEKMGERGEASKAAISDPTHTS